MQVAAQAERLAEENLQLKAEIAVLRSQLGYLHRMMLDNNNGNTTTHHVSTDEQLRQPVDNDNTPCNNYSSSSHQYQHQPADESGRTV